MKTLREMMDLITEATQAKYPVKLADMFGGGTLNQSSGKGTFVATYTNKKGEMEAKLMITPTDSRIFTPREIRGELMSGFTPTELSSRFLDMVKNDILHNHDQINSEINKHKDTLPYLKDLVNKMNGKNMKESINQDISATIDAQLKPFFDDMVIAITRVQREIAEINGTLQEDTTVNMSPYKDSIKNAETPKQKSAKNKISDLTRK